MKISSAKNSLENFLLKGTNSKFILLFKLTLDFTYRYHFLLVGIQELVHNFRCNHRLIENTSKSIYADVSLPALGVQTCLIHKQQVGHSHHSSVSLMQFDE